MNTKSQNQNSELKSRPEQRSTEHRIDFKLRQRNRQLPTEQLLNLLKGTPDFWNLAEVVGKWVWIQFAEKQPIEVTTSLSQLGFHWNNTRQTWQHPCGTITEERASFDPRRKYRSYFVARA